jgi:hypothetical protein
MQASRYDLANQLLYNPILALVRHRSSSSYHLMAPRRQAESDPMVTYLVLHSQSRVGYCDFRGRFIPMHACIVLLGPLQN